jgi:hypothetical protein
MEHPPYSPDLGVSDYYLFPKLKNHLRGCRFSSDEYLKETVDQVFEDLSSHSFIGNMLEYSYLMAIYTSKYKANKLRKKCLATRACSSGRIFLDRCLLQGII